MTNRCEFAFTWRQSHHIWNIHPVRGPVLAMTKLLAFCSPRTIWGTQASYTWSLWNCGLRTALIDSAVSRRLSIVISTLEALWLHWKFARTFRLTVVNCREACAYVLSWGTDLDRSHCTHWSSAWWPPKCHISCIRQSCMWQLFWTVSSLLRWHLLAWRPIRSFEWWALILLLPSDLEYRLFELIYNFRCLRKCSLSVSDWSLEFLLRGLIALWSLSAVFFLKYTSCFGRHFTGWNTGKRIPIAIAGCWHSNWRAALWSVC